MLKIFGIRHHGPGSARSLKDRLIRLSPDLILVEGPPDADGQIPLAALPEMSPPVALLLYLPDQPQKAVYYPFAEFSPEWQAIQYGLKNEVPVRFMDLPQANQLGESSPAGHPLETYIQDTIIPDPFTLIAEAAGYSDGERWWEHYIEQRHESSDVFQGILELITALRNETSTGAAYGDRSNLQREAYMRTIIRAAQREGYQNIAVVCGAWHAPALALLENIAADEALLKGLTKVEVAAAWVPWTYDRLSRHSGYGAGIDSPGWYEHLWQTQTLIVENWMVKVAQLMREEDLGISPAHAIEATRLAEALAAMRGLPLPGLPEMDEAVLAVFCFGDNTPLRLIHQKLIVGQRMGKIPASVPTVPLQRDLAAIQRRVRLEPSASPEIIDLDLRKPLLLERSQLLHRLQILGIPWGQIQQTRSAKGTFHEIWQVEWKPEFAVAVIEASLWGNTVLEAASSKVSADAAQVSELPALTRLVESALLADLIDAVPGLIIRVQEIAATSGDISHMMGAIPPLANVLRYGNVRNTDTYLVSQVVDELIARICIGLPSACSALDDDAARDMFAHIQSVQNTVELLQNESQSQDWGGALNRLARQDEIHGLVRGQACRLLFDRSDDGELTATWMSQALSPGTPAFQAAAWVQGFLHGSGQALIHHPRLWKLVDDWVLSLSEDQFVSLLPLLRRTFSTVPAPERRQLGEMARQGGRLVPNQQGMELDQRRVDLALALVVKILGNR